jgi:hypothetical protein
MNYNIDVITNDKQKELEDAFHSINQGRTDFQLHNFVIGQHDTDSRRFMQCVMELQAKTFNLRRQLIQKRKLLKKIDNTVDLDDKELFKIDHEELELSLEGQVREWNTLYAIFKEMPKFTHEQIQEAEEEYWQLRLARQAQEDICATGRISIGNVDAMWQAKQIDHPGIKFIEDNKNKELSQ